MIITQQQYNKVIDGLRTQLEIQRDFTAEVQASLQKAYELVNKDTAEMREMRATVLKRDEVIAEQLADLNEADAVNAMLTESVATQERALAQAKGRLAKSSKK